MALFDFLSKKPTPKKIEKLTARMLNEHHQQQVRQEAMDELVAFGTPEAILGLVRRLGVNFRDTIKNEQEKRTVRSLLVERFGEQSIQPLIDFIGEEQTISAAIRTLAQLVSADRLVGILTETLGKYPPSDHRTTDAKLQLVDALGDHEDARVVPAALPYAMDHDDDVRVKVMELLEGQVAAGHDQYDVTVEMLVKVLGDPEASGRITRRAAQALAALKADLTAQRDGLAEFLPDGYRFGDDGVVTAG